MKECLGLDVLPGILCQVETKVKRAGKRRSHCGARGQGADACLEDLHRLGWGASAHPQGCMFVEAESQGIQRHTTVESHGPQGKP